MYHIYQLWRVPDEHRAFVYDIGHSVSQRKRRVMLSTNRLLPMSQWISTAPSKTVHVPAERTLRTPRHRHFTSALHKHKSQLSPLKSILNFQQQGWKLSIISF